MQFLKYAFSMIVTSSVDKCLLYTSEFALNVVKGSAILGAKP